MANKDVYNMADNEISAAGDIIPHGAGSEHPIPLPDRGAHGGERAHMVVKG